MHTIGYTVARTGVNALYNYTNLCQTLSTFRQYLVKA